MSSVKSKSLQRAEEMGRAFDETLQATDFPPNRFVRVRDEEGCDFTFRSAIVRKWCHNEDVWFLVFTEHHCFHCFHLDEIEEIYTCEVVEWPSEMAELHEG